MTWQKVLRLGVGMAFIAGPALFVTTAGAQSVRPASSPLSLPFSASTPHCVIQLDPVLLGQKSSIATSRGCYATFPEAISAATGGRVHLPANISGSQLTPAMLQPAQSGASPLSSTCDPGCGGTVIGIDWMNANYLGDTLTYTTNNSAGCSQGANFYFSSMPSGWNDDVSSAHSYQSCFNFEHFYDVGFGYPMYDCPPSCANMGAANDQTSSVALKYNP